MRKIIYLLLLIVIFINSSCQQINNNVSKEKNIEEIINDNNYDNIAETITNETIENNMVSNKTNNNRKKNNSEEVIENRRIEEIVSCQDCFHNIGFKENVCKQTGLYYFERNKNENDEYELFDWYVFIFNEKQKYKDIKELYEPVVVNEGSIQINKGQYIYILCSYNPENYELPSNSDQTYIYYIK